jgi:hypothetical protein
VSSAFLPWPEAETPFVWASKSLGARTRVSERETTRTRPEKRGTEGKAPAPARSATPHCPTRQSPLPFFNTAHPIPIPVPNQPNQRTKRGLSLRLSQRNAIPPPLAASPSVPMTPPPPLEARDYIGLGAASGSSSSTAAGEAHLALRLGLPGSESPGRRAEAEDVDPALTLGCPAPPPALPRVAGAKRGFHDSRLDRPAGCGADAAGGFGGEEKGTGDVAAGAPRSAK